MTSFTLFGSNSNFLDLAFFSEAGTLDIDVTFSSATRPIFENLDTGFTTVASGSGFEFMATDDGRVVPVAGTFNELFISSGAEGAVAEGSLTGVDIDVATFSSALEEFSFGNIQPLAGVFNAGGPITVDFTQSAATTGFNSTRDVFGVSAGGLAIDPVVDLITQPISIMGGDMRQENLIAGSGDDTIMTGGSAGGVDFLFSSRGNDTYDLSGADAGDEYRFFYDNIAQDDDLGGITVQTVDLTIGDGTGTITQTLNGQIIGTDTLMNIETSLQAGGIEVLTSIGSDSYNIALAQDESITVLSLGGGDTFNVSGVGNVLIDYRFASPAIDDDTKGISVNLADGSVDVFGTIDTINVQGDGIVEIAGTGLSDSFTGDSENNSFVASEGSDTYSGAFGTDIVSYENGTFFDSLVVDLRIGSVNGFLAGTNVFTDRLFSIEHVRGSVLTDDFMLGSLGRDTLEGLGGDDDIIGRAGDDALFGGDGDDTLTGDDGRDSIGGGTGDDLMFGGTGADTVNAGDGEDTVFAGNGRDFVFLDEGDDQFFDDNQGGEFGQDTVFGGAGDDTIFGNNGNDQFFGQTGNDSINGDLGADEIFGGNGFDIIRGGNGSDTVFGGNGQDSVRMGNGNDLYNDNTQGGALGQDTVFGGYGDDTIEGGGGDDLFFGGAGNDVINARLGADRVFGGNGDDVITAGGGDDTINGGIGNDQFFGDAGEDVINGGADSDTISGGEGADVFIFAQVDAATGVDLVTDYELDVDQISVVLEPGSELLEADENTPTISYDSTNNEVTVTLRGTDLVILQSEDDLSGFGVEDIMVVI